LSITWLLEIGEEIKGQKLDYKLVLKDPIFELPATFYFPDFPGIFEFKQILARGSLFQCSNPSFNSNFK
jgi:hypothetical protein